MYRWYEARIGRYSLVDPLGIVEGDSHPLAFAASNPLVNTDFYGLACSATGAAFICCDGNGGFGICAPRLPSSKILSDCILEHEQDHIDWYSQNAPCQCAAQPKGHCEFELTRSQQNESECRGYEAEFNCLTKKRSQAGPDLQAVLERQRFLRKEGKTKFGCQVKRWGKETR